jgi:hypothetical protein
MRLNQYVDYIGANGRFFCDAQSWIDYSAPLDITYGLRDHGAIAAIQISN